MSIAHELMPTPGYDDRRYSPIERILKQDQRVQIDITRATADEEAVYDELGINGRAVAVIRVGSFVTVVIQSIDSRWGSDFLIVDESGAIGEDIPVLEVLEGKPLLIGRDSHADTFRYPDTVSRQQFELRYVGDRLYVQNLKPTNATRVEAYFVDEEPAFRPKHPVQDDRTVHLLDRMAYNYDYAPPDERAPYGYYKGFPIIGRNSKTIDGGVYLGGSAREAIVVNGQSGTMKKLHNELLASISPMLREPGLNKDRDILTAVMSKVKLEMPYDVRVVQAIRSRYPKDGLVNLSEYVHEYGGVCRHQALLAGYIIENLINGGILHGSIRVERNTVEDLGGTHAWASFVPKGSTSIDNVIVVDPAQTFVGTKREAQDQGRWEYGLSTDE